MILLNLKNRGESYGSDWKIVERGQSYTYDKKAVVMLMVHYKWKIAIEFTQNLLKGWSPFGRITLKHKHASFTEVKNG